MIPKGVTSIRVLAIGPGGNGGTGRASGGGSGRLQFDNYLVTPDENYSISFGNNYTLFEAYNLSQVSNANNKSIFADGGQAGMENGCTDSQRDLDRGGNGGSGGSCYPCGAVDKGRLSLIEGGSKGNKGSDAYCHPDECKVTCGGGTGQSMSTWVPILRQFKHQSIKAGQGGISGNYSKDQKMLGGGGGGGGILIDNEGPWAEYISHGVDGVNGEGGKGYGAGGGGGGVKNETKYEGGKGKDGIVYIEWDL